MNTLLLYLYLYLHLHLHLYPHLPVRIAKPNAGAGSSGLAWQRKALEIIGDQQQIEFGPLEHGRGPGTTCLFICRPRAGFGRPGAKSMKALASPFALDCRRSATSTENAATSTLATTRDRMRHVAAGG